MESLIQTEPFQGEAFSRSLIQAGLFQRDSPRGLVQAEPLQGEAFSWRLIQSEPLSGGSPPEGVLFRRNPFRGTLRGASLATLPGGPLSGGSLARGASPRGLSGDDFIKTLSGTP